MRYLLLFTLLFFVHHPSKAQTALSPNVDSLKQEILKVNLEMDHMQRNLVKSYKRLKTGVLIASVGYSVVIAGGLMLGRDNDQLGQALLVTGGVIGFGGGILIFDSFKFIGQAGSPPPAAAYP
ncbi:MAG: hypothetical protein ACNS62_16570 [Candidatus Cyclobacteriaceae bacterium M3_2C_046]